MQDDPNMRDVPTYALYGEPGIWNDAEFLHCETIQARSRLHDFRIRPHRHGQLSQLLFLEAGLGRLVHDGATHALRPPCLVPMPPLVVHSYSFSNNVEGLVLTFYERQLAAILQAGPQAARVFDAPVIPLADQPEAARAIAGALAAAAAEWAGERAGRTAMLQAHLAVALWAAWRAHGATCAPVVDQARGAGHVVRFRVMLDEAFKSHLPVEGYADRLGVTTVHLRRLCRQHLGTTPLGAINTRLALEARRLLVFTSLEVKEVAASLGFDDAAYFSRFFQREAGLSPTAFRARQRRTAPPAAPAPPAPPGDGRPATGPSSA